MMMYYESKKIVFFYCKASGKSILAEVDAAGFHIQSVVNKGPSIP